MISTGSMVVDLAGTFVEYADGMGFCVPNFGKKQTMKRISGTLAIVATVLSFAACKKSSGSSSNTSAMAGFWTYKTDVNNSDNYWNDNVLFMSNGTFRMYTA